MKYNTTPVPTFLLNALKQRWPGHTWKYIPGYEPRYLVSDFGLVYCVAADCLAVRMKASNHTFLVKLVRNGRSHNTTVHLVVAMAFIPNDDPVHKTHVSHLNGNRMDNRVTNLAWVRKLAVTERLLAATSMLQEAGAPGCMSARYLTPDQVRDIKMWRDLGIPTRIIASEVGKSIATIRNILRGDTWGSVE